MCGIGDWITGVLEKDGAPGPVVPKEGGIQWTESYCIGKGTEKGDIVKKFIQYMLSAEGQVKSAQMAAYPGFAITKSGRAKLIEMDRAEAERTGRSTAWQMIRSRWSRKAASTIGTFRCNRRSRTGTTSGPNTRTPEWTTCLKGGRRLSPVRDRIATGPECNDRP